MFHNMYWRLQMEKLHIKGGNNLYGTVEIGSAKNAYLPILAGAILCSGKIELNNFPFYRDTINMTSILKELGAKIEIDDKKLFLDMQSLNKFEIPSQLAMLTRSSIFSLGAILGRFGKARVAYPGGCDIGSRPIDLHLKGLEKLGVKIIDKHGYITCDGRNLHGNLIHLDFPSVGATENIMMAGVLAKGTTKIVNAAKEPEVVDLQNFLNKAGARIRGAGTEVITIKGVEKLHDVSYTPITDRIIAGTYVLATCICGGEICLENVNPTHLQALTSKLTENNPSIKINSKNNCMFIKSCGKLKAINKIETMPYPGFPTDLQPQMVALLSICEGTSVVVENLFETRYRYTTEFAKMGADIIIKDRSAIIKGVKNLYGAQVFASDLRGGAGLVLAGLIADGYTTIGNIEHIQRGYESIQTDLKKLGADIELVN